MTWLLIIVLAYVAGSIPFGVLIARAKGVDIRAQGSKNIGATNVGRVLGRRLGITCFGLDVLKGAVPTVTAGLVMQVANHPAAELTQKEMWLWLAVALAAVAGHIWSIFLRFDGGKGVATGFGALVVMWPLLTIPTLLALVVWYGTLRMTRYISLSSMLAACSLPLAYLLSVIPNSGNDILRQVAHASPPLIVTMSLALLVLFKHRANIGRLRRGEEPKVGLKKSAEEGREGSRH